MKKFWMVLNENTGYTRYRHETPEAARVEAERLAREIPGQKFFVLAAEGFALKRDVDWFPSGSNGVTDDGIPF